MKNKLLKILGIVMTISMLASFMVAGPAVSAAGSTTIINAWEELSLPTNLLHCNVELIEQANDGTIFISIYDETTSHYAMWKSTDGYTWSATCIKNGAYVDGDNRITAIEPSANYAVDKTVYVAVDTSGDSFTTIYRCTGSAATTVIPATLGQISAGESGTTPAVYVYSIDSYYDGDNVWLLVATDIDVFAIPDDNGLTTYWTDMELSQSLGGSYGDGADVPSPPFTFDGVEVYKARFAPDFASSGVIWALYYDEYNSPNLGTTHTHGYGLISRHSGSTLWGNVITPEIIAEGTPGDTAKAECDLEFAADYDSVDNPNIYAALNFWGSSDSDDIYSIECDFYGAAGSITPFDVDPIHRVDFCSLEVDGSVLIAGSFDHGFPPNANTEVWVSLNDGITWNMASKNPTGEVDYTCNLLISKFGATDGKYFAATGGIQSAISISADMGDTWNQIAFIDDDIDEIVDLAFDPTSKAALMITCDDAGTESLWKTDDVNVAKPAWQRTLCEEYSVTDIEDFDLVEFSNDGTVVMLYDDSLDKIFRSSDDAQTFTGWKTTASWGEINDWVVYDSSSVYAACDNGFWSTAVVGSDLTAVPLASIAIQSGFNPDDAAKDVLVVGDYNGNAYISLNAGDDLETAVAVGGGGEKVSVAFDSKNIIYFAVGTDVESAAIGTTNIGTLATGAAALPSAPIMGTYVDIVIAADDTLYVLDNDGDMARWLLYDTNTEWDLAMGGAASTDELWITKGSNVAWTIDNANAEVWLLDDTLSGMVTGVVVSSIGPFSATISWASMTGAEVYEIVFLYAGDDDGLLDDLYFLPVYIDAPATSFDTSDVIPVIPFLSDATAFAVVVRVNNDADSYIANEVELSRWSAAKTFTTKYYMDTPTPVNPGQGYNQASTHPSFGWSAVPNAKTYKFQLSADPTFATLIDEKSVTTTAYTYAGDKLTYDSDYYWRVQAVGPDATVSKWSSYTENYFSITLEEFMAGWNVDDVFGFFRNGDMVFYWRSGAISNFHTMIDPAAYQSDLTVILPSTTVTSVTYTLPVNIPDITIDPPTITASITVPAGTTTVTSINLVVPDNQTPVYIWAIVAIGALLTIAVIVLIIRTRRVV